MDVTEVQAWEPSVSETVRKVVLFSGHVQGVGFRYTARRIADQYEVSGYVRNLPNGDVELLAEGSDSQTEQMINNVRQTMKDYIHNCTVDTLAPTGEFDSFGIRY